MAAAEAQVAQAMVSIGEKLGAPLNAILACLCIGAGENSWNTTGCNASNHCGIFQLSGALQSEHNYTDYIYWTYRAYQSGFWRGSLIGNARANPSASPGYLANLCQGAYSDLTQGAAYYNQYVTTARNLYNQYRGSAPPAGPVSAGVVSPSGTAAGAVDLTPIQNAIDGSSAGDAMGPPTVKAAERAHRGYVVSHDTWYRIKGLSTFDKHGGR